MITAKLGDGALEEPPITVLCSGGRDNEGAPRHAPTYFGRRPGDYSAETGLHVKCPRCGLTPRISARRFRKLVAAYRSNGMDSLDISSLRGIL